MLGALKHRLVQVPLVAGVLALWRNATDAYCWPRSRDELRALLDRFPGSDEESILEISNRYRGSDWYKRVAAIQIESEFRELIRWAGKNKPAVIVEIGTAQGASLLAWCRIARERVISVDLPRGIHGGGYHPQKQPLYREFARGRSGVRIDLIQADSHSEATRARALALLEGRRIDMLYIDGDHTLAGVTRDYELWGGLVAPGGHIVFHDILAHPAVADCQVDRLWERLCLENPGRTREI